MQHLQHLASSKHPMGITWPVDSRAASVVAGKVKDVAGWGYYAAQSFIGKGVVLVALRSSCTA